MASLLAKFSVPPVQQSLKKKAAKLYKDESLFVEAMKLEESFHASFGCRWHSPTTEAGRDQVLREYREVMALVLSVRSVEGVVLLPGQTEDVNDHILFPADPDLLLEYICEYLIFAARNVCGKNSKRPAKASIAQKRMRMLYWITNGRKATCPIPMNEFWLRTTESIEFVGQELGYMTNAEARKKTWLGREDLSLLIDYDMTCTPNIAVAEQHHVAWLFGMICGVRPGTLALAKGYKDQFLVWGDIQLTREPHEKPTDTTPLLHTGNFILQVTFRYLKGYRNNSPEAAAMQLKLVVLSPSHDYNMSLSLPHRLLVILLRRGYLQDHDSLSSLMSGTEYSIKIKADALKEPVFLKSTPRGLKLEEGFPALSQSFTPYLQNRAIWCGLPKDITFYCWRRSAGTAVNRALGLEKTRQFMAHAPGSAMFEKYYDKKLYDIDLVNIMLDGEDGRANSEVLKNVASASLHRAKIEKSSLDRELIIRTFVDEHDDVLEATRAGDPATIKRVKKRIRNAARTAIIDEERSMQTLSMAELASRLMELKRPSRIFQMISERALHQISQTAEIEDSPEIQTPGIHTGNDFMDIEEMEETEGIVLDIGRHNQGLPCDEVNLGDQDDVFKISPSSGSNATAVLWPDKCIDLTIRIDSNCDIPSDRPMIATTFMNLLMDFQPDKPKKWDCPICRGEPWVSEEKRSHDYGGKQYLNVHMHSTFHSPYNTWCRKLRALCADLGDPKNFYHCPYNCNYKSQTMRRLVTHIKESSVITHGIDHDEAKREDGWYDDDFGQGFEGKRAVAESRKRKPINTTTFQESKKPVKILVSASIDGTVAESDNILFYGGDIDDTAEYDFSGTQWKDIVYFEEK